MRAAAEVRLSVSQEWEAWMHVANPDLSMEEAEEKLKSLGNLILEVDHEGRRIKVMHETNLDCWVCDYCGSFSKDKQKIMEHEETCSKRKN